MSNKKELTIDDKKQTKLVLLMSIILILVMAIGITYAYFQASVSAQNISSNSCFDIAYAKQGNVVGELKPLEDGADYKTAGAVAQVNMNSTCDNVNIAGRLYFTTNNSSTFNFSSGHLKYVVVVGSQEVATGYIDGTENQVIYDNFLLNRSSTAYKVYFYLDGDYVFTGSKTFSGYIHSEASAISTIVE